MKITNHLLTGNNIDFKQSPNHSGKFKSGLPDSIVIHYTAGRSHASSVTSLSTPASKASAHLVVGRDEKITQLVPFNTAAWHAGQSSYEGRVGFNQYSIGFEIDNSGLLTKAGDKYLSWFGKDYPESEVIKAIHRNESVARYWHRYSEWQIEACQQICELLIEKYNIKTILGHEEISPKRKIDPGPAFPLDKFREKIFETDRSEDTVETDIDLRVGKVTASSLNIRSGPDVENEKVAPSLPQGTKLTILDKQDGWYKVRTEVEGWVFAKHVK